MGYIRESSLVYIWRVWLALSHALAAIVSFITIIGIPFGIQHGKLARISLSPIEKEVVDKEVAEQARKKNAE